CQDHRFAADPDPSAAFEGYDSARRGETVEKRRAFSCFAANSFGFMNVLILAAGYATRLYPLTLNKAKPLLVLGGKPIIEWLVDNLQDVPDLETIFVVTNDKFARDFQAWSEGYQVRHSQFKFKIVNDGSKSDGDKLGAIGDINF